MSIITVFSGNFCGKDRVVGKLAERTGFRVVADSDVTALAAKLSGMSEDKIAKALSGKTSVFNAFTREKERSVAWMRLAAAQIIQGDDMLFDGFTGMLVPASVSHMLRVCLIADVQYRLTQAAKKSHSEKDAAKLIRSHDENCAAWVDTLHRSKDPWTSGLYDILIPMNEVTPDDAVDIVLDNLAKDVLKTTGDSENAAKDFLLAAGVETILADQGHDVSVSAQDGRVLLTVNKNVMMLSRLEAELKEAASKIEGVGEVDVKVGSGFYQSDIYRRADFEMPSKVLLVDDEREFVQTLSERLAMREVGAHAVYDGESALDLVAGDEPEVMILDLKMPGIDGMEVLKRVKAENPAIEVIILTGHGSEDDRKVCMDLGAFAYLHKPVDIELLSKTLKDANDKIKAARSEVR